MAFSRRRFAQLWTPLCVVVAALTGASSADEALSLCPLICYTTTVYGDTELGTTCACVLNTSAYERTPLDTACQCQQCYVQQPDGKIQTFAYGSDGTCQWNGTDCSNCELSSSSTSGSSTITSTPTTTPTSRPLSASPAPTTGVPSPSPTPQNAAAQASSSSSWGRGGWKNALFVAIFACGCALAVGAVFLLTRDLYHRAKGANAVGLDDGEEHFSNGELRGVPMRTTAPYDHLGDSNQVYEVLVYPVGPLSEDRGPPDIRSQTF